jgi:uncharacterized membrane protein
MTGNNGLRRGLFAYPALALAALLFLYAGNRVASSGMAVEYGGGPTTVEADVARVLDVSESGFSEWTEGTVVTFEAAVRTGERKGETLTAVQTLGSYLAIYEREVAEGDRVLLISSEGDWHFAGYVRFDKILVLGAVFVVLLLLFGRMKGFCALLALGFTCAAIFSVFIPAVLSGKNIYAATVVVCVFSIVVTLFIVYGVNRKSLSAVAGCFGGVSAAALLTLVKSRALRLTGFVDEESLYLLFLPTKEPIDLKAIIFAGIIIGAVGAVMDVAVSIASALSELTENAPEMTRAGIFRSGVNIGKDIMGSMTNTLVLAYIGSSLSVLLLLIVYAGSFAELLNGELVIVEFLQALIGSLGILLTMPLTALVCALLYAREPAPEDACADAVPEDPYFRRTGRTHRPGGTGGPGPEGTGGADERGE